MTTAVMPQPAIMKDALEHVALIRSDIKSDLIDAYDQWTNYDEHVSALSYSGSRQTAAGLAANVSGKRDISILDVGAGTGAVAEELKKLGFTNVDALDPSEGMLKIAKDKQIYQKFFIAPFTENVECIETSSYDALVSSGSFESGHMQNTVLREMIRCVKPGGLVVLVFNDGVPAKLPKLIPTIEELQEEGKWQCLENITFPGYLLKDHGIRYVMRVL